MGHTIWVETHGRPIEETADDSSTMHRLMDKLDALADQLNVQKLSEFYDYSELETAYGDCGDDDLDIKGKTDPIEPTLEERQAKGLWFDSQAGLASTRTLRQHLTDHFDDLAFTHDTSTSHWPEQLMAELTHTEDVLDEAVKNGRQFRLLIVP